MAFSEGGTPYTVRVDFYEDAVTFREKEGAVEEITSGDQIYQAYIDLVQARARKVFEHLNPDTSRPAVPLSTIKNKTTDLKRVGLIEELDKDGNAPDTGQRPERAPGGSPGRGRVGGKGTTRSPRSYTLRVAPRRALLDWGTPLLMYTQQHPPTL